MKWGDGGIGISTHIFSDLTNETHVLLSLSLGAALRHLYIYQVYREIVRKED